MSDFNNGGRPVGPEHDYNPGNSPSQDPRGQQPTQQYEVRPHNPDKPVQKNDKQEKPKARVLPGLLAGIIGGVIAALIVVAFALPDGDVADNSALNSEPAPQEQSQSIAADDSKKEDDADKQAKPSAPQANVAETLPERVAEKVIPSVVSIDVYMGDSRRAAGVGSGVILDKEGHILTNDHVISGGTMISVKANDKAYEATLVGADPSSDLAVLKIDAPDLVPIEIGDSTQLSVGEWVMAIGSPFGYEKSVSIGIVSALYRSTSLPTYDGGVNIYANLIQTDAAINPGNSGGALVNANGELIGINSLIESGAASSSGVGFAIPIDYAENIVSQILAGEEVRHAYMGVSLKTITPFAAREYTLASEEGALVIDVTEGSPAADAGILEGDVIVSLGGEPVRSADDLIIQVRRHKIGDTVEVGLERNGGPLDVTITLGSDEVLHQPDPRQDQQGDRNTDDFSPQDLYEFYNQFWGY